MQWQTIDTKARSVDSAIQTQRVYAQPQQPDNKRPIISEVDLTKEAQKLGEKAIAIAKDQIEKDKGDIKRRHQRYDVPELSRTIWSTVGCVVVSVSAIGTHAIVSAPKGVINFLGHFLKIELPTGDDDEKPSGSNIERLRQAIVGQESGGNFKAVNPHSGALGYAQLMPSNVSSWTKEALGRSLTPQEFLQDREAQIKTIDHKLQQYWDEAASVAKSEDEIVRRVASKWYSGQSHLWNNTNPQTYNGASYPSIADYTLSVLTKFESASTTTGAIVFPVQGVTYAENEALYPSGNHDFGPRTFGGKPDMHQGYDVNCAIGQPWLASIDGVVRHYDGDPGGWGKGAFWIEAEDGAIHIYGHGDRVAQDGDRVEAGDVVGKCNSYGKSTGPHLHFEIRPNGLGSKAIDPEPYLKGVK